MTAKYRIGPARHKWAASKPGHPTGYGVSPRTAFSDAERRANVKKRLAGELAKRDRRLEQCTALIQELRDEATQLSIAAETPKATIRALQRELRNAEIRISALVAEVQTKRAKVRREDMLDAWIMVSMAYFKEPDPISALDIIFRSNSLKRGISVNEVAAATRVQKTMDRWKQRLEGGAPLDFSEVFQEEIIEQIALRNSDDPF